MIFTALALLAAATVLPLAALVGYTAGTTGWLRVLVALLVLVAGGVALGACLRGEDLRVVDGRDE